MRRAMRTTGPDFMRVLKRYKSPAFRVAVKNFYASFLAARHIAVHSSDFFTHTVSAKPLVYHSILLKHDVSVDRVVKVFGVKRAQLKKDNPALTRFVWRGWRLIPAGYQLKLPYRSHQWKQQKKTLLALKPETFAPGGVNYRVKRGDTACVVARKFAVSCRDLILANRLNRKAVIRVGQKLIIPKQATAGQVAKQSGKTNTAKATTKDGYYTVKRGDTACGIAQRFNVNRGDFFNHPVAAQSADADDKSEDGR